MAVVKAVCLVELTVVRTAGLWVRNWVEPMVARKAEKLDSHSVER